MKLYPHQDQAVRSVESGWAHARRQLLVAATGAGKTVMFSHLAKRQEGRTLILAHREELVDQAVKKLRAATGIEASVEMGKRRSTDTRVVVASVQSMRTRMHQFDRKRFDLIVADEAHLSLADEWQEVLGHFDCDRILGVTATPSRSDKKALGEYYERIAFEINLLDLIKMGYLCPLRAKTLDVEITTTWTGRKKNITEKEAEDALSPQMLNLAKAVAAEIWDRKALIFLPSCKLSKQFADVLKNVYGIDADHIQGDDKDRKDKREWFAQPGPKTMCNAQLWSTGFDQPDIDCIVWLRMTDSAAFFQQGIGRGTRISPGKDHCLILDPLWITEGMDLCRPADLLGESRLKRDAVQRLLDGGEDLVSAVEKSEPDVEAALIEQLKEAQRDKKAPKGLINPLAWSIGIHDSDLSTYEPTMPWELDPPTEAQIDVLKRWKIYTENIRRGYAEQIIERIMDRSRRGMATPPQVMLLNKHRKALEKRGLDVQLLTFDEASSLITQLKRNRFRYL